jgi:diacylglycerol O-acyltransferase
VIVDGVGLNIMVMSYRDDMDFGIVADREQADDVWSLLDGARRALDELAALVGVRAEAPKAGSPAAKTLAPG